MAEPSDAAAFRDEVRALLERTGLSMRGLSRALGRDPGYIAAVLDPAHRPSRARPTPHDLVRLSDASGIPLVELLERIWGIEPARLARELGRPDETDATGLGPEDAAVLAGVRELLVRYPRRPVDRERQRSTGSS